MFAPCLPRAYLVPAQELELALNEVTPEGAAAVAACVAAKPALRRLNLRENELEDEGAVTIAKVGAAERGAGGLSSTTTAAGRSRARCSALNRTTTAAGRSRAWRWRAAELAAATFCSWAHQVLSKGRPHQVPASGHACPPA